jgi:uncharacterized membrane protein
MFDKFINAPLWKQILAVVSVIALVILIVYFVVHYNKNKTQESYISTNAFNDGYSYVKTYLDSVIA